VNRVDSDPRSPSSSVSLGAQSQVYVLSVRLRPTEFRAE